MTVTALDDYTVECVLPGPFAPFLRSMGTAIYPQHILEKHVDDGSFTDTWNIDTDPAEIIGTGPLTIGAYEPGERVVMRRNQNYWLKDDAGNSLPYLDEIVHVLVPDLETELEKFLAGESDVHGVLGEEYARLEPLQEEGGFTIFRRGPAFGTTFLGFNMNPGETGHRRALRQSPEAQLVPEHPVPPGRGAQHRQGHDHRRRAARPRLPTVGIHLPRRWRLPQPDRSNIRILVLDKAN